MTTRQELSADGLRFSESARRAVDVACSRAGVDGSVVEPLRLGENALYRLPWAGAVARVARSMSHWSDALKEVAVARWLTEQNIPAATVLNVAQPVEAAGHPVTFWEFIAGRPGRREDIATLGAVLRRLHALLAPRGFDLPADNLLGRVKPRVAGAPIAVTDRDFLLARCEELRSKLDGLVFPLSPGPVHGDAHVANLMMTTEGPILIDFERFAWGQPEWDLAMTATEYVTAGWWTGKEYRQFVNAYGGFDVTEWGGFEVLRAVQELKMTTWIMQNINESSKIADEYAARMRTLRGEGYPNWSPF